MTITRESITARLATLKGERQSLLDNCNAYNGAIGECERMLATLDEPEPPPPPGFDSDRDHQAVQELLNELTE